MVFIAEKDRERESSETVDPATVPLAVTDKLGHRRVPLSTSTLCLDLRDHSRDRVAPLALKICRIVRAVPHLTALGHRRIRNLTLGRGVGQLGGLVRTRDAIEQIVELDPVLVVLRKATMSTSEDVLHRVNRW